MAPRSVPASSPEAVVAFDAFAALGSVLATASRLTTCATRLALAIGRGSLRARSISPQRNLQTLLTCALFSRSSHPTKATVLSQVLITVL